MKTINLLASSLLLFSTTIYANDSQQSNWNYFGEFKTYFTQIKKEKENAPDYEDLLNYNAIQINIDYLNDGFYFSATPYAYFYFTESGEKLRNSNFSTACEYEEFFFRSLYASYTFDKLTIGAGVLPISNSFPMQYTSDYYQDGEGLSIMSDMDPLAVFFKYRFNDEHRISLGFGYTDTKFIPSAKYINEYQEEDTYGIFLTQSITHEKFKIINDFKYSNLKFDTIDSGELYSIGSGVSWDDSEYSGWSLYNVFALSLYKNNSIEAKDAILAANPSVTPAIMAAYPSSFVFDNDTYKGAANLFGVRKDLDILDIESFINIEWFHTFGDWASLNKGTPYNSNCNQISNIRNNSYFINYGIRLNELSTFKINYTYLEFNEIQNIGAPSSTPLLESYGTQRKSSEFIKISFSYKF